MNSSYVFFGVSGSGKGTQAELLQNYLSGQEGKEVLHMQTGGLFREFMKQDSYSAHRVKSVLEEGGLLPAFLPIWIWTEYLINNFTGKEELIVDGASRRLIEAPVLDSALSFYEFKNKFVIYLLVSEEEAKRRLLARARHDDTLLDIKNRFAWFRRDVMPVIEYFKEKSGYRFLEVDGERSVEEIHEDIISRIKN